MSDQHWTIVVNAGHEAQAVVINVLFAAVGRDDTLWRVRSDRSQFRCELVRRMSRSALAERARKTEMTGGVSAEISQKMFKEWRGDDIHGQPLW